MSMEEIDSFLNGSVEITIRDLRDLGREHLREELVRREGELFRGERFVLAKDKERDVTGLTTEELDDYTVAL